MTACLPPLGDYRIHPRSDRSPCLLCTPDRMHHDPACVVDALDVASRIAPRERHDPQACLERFVETAELVPRENKVPTEGSGSQRRRLAHYGCDVCGPRQRQRPEPAGIRDRRGKLRNRSAPNRRLPDRPLNPEEAA